MKTKKRGRQPSAEARVRLMLSLSPRQFRKLARSAQAAGLPPSTQARLAMMKGLA